MFKKSLLALAITGFVGSASAAVLDSISVPASPATKVTVSVEGNAAMTTPNLVVGTDVDTVAGDFDIAITTGVEYIENDVITFTFTGATINETLTGTPTLYSTYGFAAAATAAEVAATATFLDIVDGNTVRFRVDVGGLAAGTYALDDVVLNTAAASGTSSISVSSSAISTNPIIGTYDAGASTKLVEFDSQLDVTVTNGFNAVVDVENSREQWIAETDAADADDGSASDGVLQDSLVLTLADDTTLINALTYTGYTAKITGTDLSYLLDYDADESGTLTGSEITDATDVAGGAVVTAIDLTKNQVTATVTAAAGETVTMLNVGKTTGSVISAQDFSVEVTATDGTNVATVPAESAGSWTLNGSQDDIAFLPFGSDYAQSITVTNTGSVEGAITVDLTANGMTYTKTLSQIASAKSVTNISLAVAAFAAESGITDNARINIVVNAPAANIAVKGLYFHKPTADRVLTY